MPQYMAPEMLVLCGYAQEADWWSLGVLLYECFHNYTPFSNKGFSDNDMEILRAIERFGSNGNDGQLDFQPTVPSEGQGLITGLLRKGVSSRFGSKQTRLSPFLAGFDWLGLMHKRITPPYLPAVSSDPFDMSNFEPDLDPEDSGLRLLAEEATGAVSEENEKAFADW